MTFLSSNRSLQKKSPFLRKIKDLTSFRSKVIDDVRTATPYRQKNAKEQKTTTARSKLERMSKMAALNQSPTYFSPNFILLNIHFRSKNLWKLRQHTLALASGKTFDCNRSSGEESGSEIKYKSFSEE